jgi:NAD(P)-dependent dehydrogenase (short-subunit alcohol dehydrogenase family)
MISVTSFPGSSARRIRPDATWYWRRGADGVIGISSVAGGRGRARNATYGSAKVGFTAYLSGLRIRLHGAGVRVVAVLPGYVVRSMTKRMTTPRLLTAQPAGVAEAVLAAELRRRDVSMSDRFGARCSRWRGHSRTGIQTPPDIRSRASRSAKPREKAATCGVLALIFSKDSPDSFVGLNLWRRTAMRQSIGVRFVEIMIGLAASLVGVALHGMLS